MFLSWEHKQLCQRNLLKQSLTPDHALYFVLGILTLLDKDPAFASVIPFAVSIQILSFTIRGYGSTEIKIPNSNMCIVWMWLNDVCKL